MERSSVTLTVKVNTYSAAAKVETSDFKTAALEKVVLYTTQRCGYCKKAKRYLKANNIRYTEYDVETNRKGQRDFKKLKATGVPVILVGDQRMNGFSEGKMQAMLRSAGYRI